MEKKSCIVAGLATAAWEGCPTKYRHRVLVLLSLLWSLLLLALSYGGVTIQQPGVLGVCLDIGGKYAGAVTGAMNTATYVAAFVSSVVYGYIASSFGYTAPFLPMIALLIIGAVLWFSVDPAREVIADTAPEAPALVA